ncbi:transcription termination factor NusA [Holdemanella biformis]|jgi:N utilization substance protein A|uniref:transcription termination factor NusA n=1 Tax=Holdemanella biformis TaxID=1735 RepID=UPI0025D18752|nr:transcription termination factor NusA [Holdemanella biformis]
MKPKIKVKDIAKALQGIETDRQLTKEIVEDALKEALTKAYRKHIEIPDAYVRVDIINDTIHIYHERMVVEEVEDDELEIELEEARKENPNIQLGDMVDEEVDFTDFERAAVVLAKNVMKQKIREAEKALVYEEYCDKVDEMVLGTIETVEEKFVVVNIGKTYAVMKKSDQIPTEHYKEGDNILVVITEVNKETKGAQVLVSRATPVFVRRLFEREVPEIYNGIIEIKAIARDPGERCKIAVYSHNENIDPIGACIGPRGSRVQTIINELHGEKIDIFEWSDNISELIANALSPSVGVAVIPNETVKDGLIVVVPDNQLSLAIGKRGKNARLAVKLTNHKIDIKSETEMQELGIDYMAISAKMQQEYEEKKAKERAYKQQQKIEELKSNESEIENIDVADFTYEDEEVDAVEEHAEDTLFEKENTVKEAKQEKEVDEMEEAARIAKQNRKEKTAADVKEYTSKFESMADASNKQEEVVSKPKKEKEKVEEEKKPVEVKKFNYEDMKPIYSEEELAEIEEQEYEEENAWDDDVDYEEYDEYYDD